jgi:hypothetical protein
MTVATAASTAADETADREAWIAARVAEAPPLDAWTLGRLRALLPPVEAEPMRSAS